jgi:hypothetical protein
MTPTPLAVPAAQAATVQPTRFQVLRGRPDRGLATREACRRATPRAAHRRPCAVTVFDASVGGWVTIQAETINVSSEGLGLHIAQPIPVGTRIEAQVFQHGMTPLSISGKVMHRRRVLTGVYELGVRAIVADSELY